MAFTTSPGQMRQRVDIQQPALVSDGMGGQATTWSTLATVWAQATVASGTLAERIQAGSVVASSPYVFLMRYRADVTPAHRIVWRGQAFEIHGADDPDGKRRWLLVTATTTGL